MAIFLYIGVAIALEVGKADTVGLSKIRETAIFGDFPFGDRFDDLYQVRVISWNKLVPTSLSPQVLSCST